MFAYRTVSEDVKTAIWDLLDGNLRRLHPELEALLGPRNVGASLAGGQGTCPMSYEPGKGSLFLAGGTDHDGRDRERKPPTDGGNHGGGGPMEDLTRRVDRIEGRLDNLNDMAIKTHALFEAHLPNLATKTDVAETKTAIEGTKGSIEKAKNSLIIWGIGTALAVAGLALGIMQYVDGHARPEPTLVAQPAVTPPIQIFLNGIPAAPAHK